jgi:hypothetical protein
MLESNILKYLNRFSTVASHSMLRKVKSWREHTKQVPSIRSHVMLTCLRNKTWIDWAIYIATKLRTLGVKTTLLIKKSEVDRIYGRSFHRAIAMIPDVEVFDLESAEPPQNARLLVDELNFSFVIDSLAYDLHLERQDILDDARRFEVELTERTNQYKTVLTQFVCAIRSSRFDKLILYSGLIAETPAMLQLSIKLGLPTHTIEGWAWRKGHVVVGKNCPALEYDIKFWQERHGWSQDKEDRVDQYIKFQDQGKSSAKGFDWTTTFYNVQPTSSDVDLPPHVKKFIEAFGSCTLLAPNVVGDSSTLNRESIFPGMRSWILQVIDFYKSNPEQGLIIRAHPAETWVKSKVKIRMGDVALKFAAGLPNVLVVPGTEKLNTFALTKAIKLGLVWISSVGVDLVARGVPVIVAARPKYTGLGIVNEPETVDEYFRSLAATIGADGGNVTSIQRENARRYLYTVFAGFSYLGHGTGFDINSLDWNELAIDKTHIELIELLASVESNSK